MSTCKEDNVDVVFGGLTLVRDSQVVVNIFFQPGESPTRTKNTLNKNKWQMTKHITVV